MDIPSFIEDLQHYSSANVFNPWQDYDNQCDISADAPIIRSQQFQDYLEQRIEQARYVFVAEAAGYQGCHFTGIAITCERMLLNKHKQITSAMVLGHAGLRTSNPECPLMTSAPQREAGMNEPTDTYVWGSIIDNGLDPRDVILWNIFPFHPHKPNNLFTNRTPTDAELADGLEYTKNILQLCKNDVSIAAIGQKSTETLTAAGYDVVSLRHPANGGAGKFRQQFQDWVTK